MCVCVYIELLVALTSRSCLLRGFHSKGMPALHAAQVHRVVYIMYHSVCIYIYIYSCID